MKRAEFPIFKKFMDFLDNDTLQQTLAGYWGAVLTSLYNRFSDKCIEYFCNFPEYFNKLTKHLYSAAITEFVQKLLTDDNNHVSTSMITTYQKLKGDLISSIINLLASNNKDQILNAYQLLFNCIDYRCAIVDIIASESNIKLMYAIASQMVGTCKASDQSRASLRCCLGIFKQMLESNNKPQPILMMDSPKKSDENISISPIITEVTKIKEILEIAKFAVDKEVEKQGFKSLRIAVVEFVNALLLTNNPGVCKMLYDIKIYHEFTQYFLMFPDCSLLLYAVMEGLAYLCKNSTYSEFIKSVLEEEAMINLLTNICNQKQINQTIYCFQYELLKLFLENKTQIEANIPSNAREEYTRHKSLIAQEIGSGIYKNLLASQAPPTDKKEETSPPRAELEEVRVQVDSPFDDDKEEVNTKEQISEMKDIEKPMENDVKAAPTTPIYNMPVDYIYTPTFPYLHFEENQQIQLPPSSQTYLG